MHLVYIDEVKYNHVKNGEDFYWLGALAFPEDSIKSIEKRLSKISLNYFGSGVISKETEFHAKDIVHGKAAYKGHKMERRFKLFISLLIELNLCLNLKKIEIRINPKNMVTNKSYQDMAFMFLVEKVNALMVSENSTALLISDHDKDMVSSNVASLSSYKEKGTMYQFGMGINHIVDTIHHTHSHHSRLVQMADIYVYTMALKSKKKMRFPRKDILDFAFSETDLCRPSKYKYWPIN